MADNFMFYLTLQNNIKGQFKSAGIHIPEEEEWLTTERMPLFYVHIDSWVLKPESKTYLINAQFQQKMSLSGSTQKILAYTWTRTKIHSGDRESVGPEVTKLVEEFINNFLEMNP